MPQTGRFVLVVGPSGAGKDTLIARAKHQFADDAHMRFPKRAVTRTANEELEDHETIDRAQFDALRERGDFALCWEAHGLGYVIPSTARQDMERGMTVVCNVSRRVIRDAVERLPHVVVVVVTADLDIRAERLAMRGRESHADISARLAREGAPLPEGVAAEVIDNSGDLNESVEAFCRLLERFGKEADGQEQA